MKRKGSVVLERQLLPLDNLIITDMRRKKKDKWSNKHERQALFRCWNPWGYSNERHEYCKELGYDILGLVELHNAHTKRQFESQGWVCSQAAEVKDGKCIDPAAGVAIMLSTRMTTKVLSQGSVGTRIAWVRVAGPVCNLFFVVTYIPHKGRTNPCAQDTIKQLQTLLKGVTKSDCIILCGDFNCQLQRHVKGCTGKWCMTKRPDNGHSEDVLELMRSYDLFAADTMFKPAKKTWGPKKRKHICNATYLQKDNERRPTKLDYFCVSNRWKSMVINARVQWGPSLHRFGQKFDHGLLSATWRWKTKRGERPRRPDFKAMNDQSWRDFDSRLQIKLQEDVTATSPRVASADTVTIRCGQQKRKVDYNRITTCVQETMDEVVPEKERMKKHGRTVSKETKALFEERKRAFAKRKPTKAQRKQWNDKITRSCRNDYRAWVSRCVEEIEKADAKGDTRTVFKATKTVSGLNNSFASKQPTLNSAGLQIHDSEELANVWKNFLAQKFSASCLERQRAEFELLPENDGLGGLTRQEFDKAVDRMKPNKATGKDGVPAEVWQNSKTARDVLFCFLKKIWRKEYVPPELAVCVFVLIFKKKGSSEDLTKYRAIGLLNHAYKILSVILLHRLTTECSSFFSDWQAGFRQERGCRDNILLLRVLYDNIINGNSNCVVTYIDYTAAFDTVSHKYLDSALAKAGASRKTRAIFRAIYSVAAGMVRANSTDGKKIYSETFDVRRGVIQGDIISPVLFILALDQLFQQNDTLGSGYNCSNILTLRVLGYADDAALIEPTVDAMTARLSAIANASLLDADMQVSMAKTYTQHVGKHDKVAVSKAEAASAQKNFDHKCEYCDRKFKTARAMKIHTAHCMYAYSTTEERFEVESIIGVFGSRANRWFLVKWTGYDEPEWERGHLLAKDGCHDSIRDFWLRSGLSPCTEFYDDPHGKNRCEVCAKTYKRPQDLKAHITRTGHSVSKEYGSSKAAYAAVEFEKRKEQQDALPKVLWSGTPWGDTPADNCWRFKYLGSNFEADGGQTADVLARIAMAQQRFGKMRHLWKDASLHLNLRLRLYRSSVCSVMTYGSEAWRLTTTVQKHLNGANSKMVSVITGKSPQEEASRDTRTVDLVRCIRARRLQWLGHILRMDDDRLVKKAVFTMYTHPQEGDILMDAPDTSTWEELCAWAASRDTWRNRVKRIGAPRVARPAPSRYSNRIRGIAAETPAALQTARQVKASKAKNDRGKSEARAYRNRDAHALFFGPTAARPKPKIKTKIKKKKKKQLTDKQRQVWAHAHFIINHGTATDARQFLQVKENTRNIDEETATALQLMCTDNAEQQTATVATAAAASPAQVTLMPANQDNTER